MNILSLLFVCSLLFYANAGPFWENLDQCTTSPAASPQPTLALSTGVWYIYAVSADDMNEALKCASCLIWKDGSDYKMQCIAQYMLGPSIPSTCMLAWITGTLTFASNKFTFTAGDKTYEAAITTYDSTMCRIVAEVCEETFDFSSLKYVTNPVKFYLAKKGATPTQEFAIVQTGCKAVTYDKTKRSGVDVGESPLTTTRSPDKIPETCTELGFKAAGTRFVKYFAGPKTKADAKKDCECQGYKLATVDTQAALDAVKTCLDGQSGTKEAWIGLEHTDQANPPTATGAKGTYKWCDWCSTTLEVTIADGTATPFAKWCAGDCDDGTTHYDKLVDKDSLSCFTLDPTACSTTFGWKERDCTTKLPYLCECNMCPQCPP